MDSPVVDVVRGSRDMLRGLGHIMMISSRALSYVTGALEKAEAGLAP
jgi:hypothetical protein